MALSNSSYILLPTLRSGKLNPSHTTTAWHAVEAYFNKKVRVVNKFSYGTYCLIKLTQFLWTRQQIPKLHNTNFPPYSSTLQKVLKKIKWYSHAERITLLKRLWISKGSKKFSNSLYNKSYIRLKVSKYVYLKHATPLNTVFQRGKGSFKQLWQKPINILCR